jgi:hypothetical protein
MSIFTAKEIANQFNEAVMFFIERGYIISPFTENGSYSNTKTHIDLIKPNDNSHILRVWMVEETLKVGKDWWQKVDVVGPRVKKYMNGIGYDGKVAKEQTLWPGKGVVVYEKLFYMFKERNGNKVFSDDLDEATRLVNLALDRMMNQPVDNPFNYGRRIAKEKLPSNFIDGIMRRINSKPGFKRAHANCIDTIQIYKYDNKLKADIKYNYNGKTGIITLK